MGIRGKKTFRRKPAEPVTYKSSSELRRVAEALIAKHPTTFGHLRNFKLAFLMVMNRRPPSDQRIDGLVTAWKASPRVKELSGYHAGVDALEASWGPLTEEQREVLVYHGLAHLGMNDKGDLRLDRHDVEAFMGEARLFGTNTRREIVRLAEQLDLFEKPGERVPAKKNGGDQPQPTATA
jgi:putative metallopeptidase